MQFRTSHILLTAACLVLYFLPPASAWAKEAEAPPPYEALTQAGDCLETLLDQRQVAWPQRPVEAEISFPLETLWSTFASRWAAAPVPLRSAYARLSYTRAHKADQWHQITGGMGTPRLDEYFAALDAPFSQALLALDDLGRVLDYAAGRGLPADQPALTEADLPTLEALAQTMRTLVQELTPPASSAAPLSLLLEAFGTPLGLEQMRMVHSGPSLALSSPFPSVRHGSDLALYLTIWAGVAAQSAPNFAHMAILLHEQGLPLLELELEGAAWRDFLAGRAGLRQFWRSWQVVDYTEGTPLATAQLLLHNFEVPAAWQVSSPVQMPPTTALSLAGLGASAPEGSVRDAAVQEVSTPAGSLYLGAVLGTSPAAIQALALAAAPASAQMAGTHPPVLVLPRGPVLFILTGPASVLKPASQALSQVTVLPGQPQVEVPPPVLAALQIEPEPASPSVEDSPRPDRPEASADTSLGGCLHRAVMCQSVDEHRQPEGVATAFPAGLSKLGLYFECRNAPLHTQLSLEWYRENECILRQLVMVSGNHKAVSYIYPNQGDSLKSGNYQVFFYQDGEQIYRLDFKIGD